VKILSLQNRLLLIFTSLALMACSSSATVSPSQKLALVQLGMGKAQVIEIMGTPGATAASDTKRY
jgi:outer membrane protein assembly factor BamE (lipoprotein component of BamABCDE complex)